MENLFVYGSLILEKSPIRLIPLESVFLLEHKLILKQKKGSNYFYLQVIRTGKSSDIIAGYLTIVPNDQLERIDRYEGTQYERKRVVIYKRDNTPLKAFVYMERK